MTPIARQERSTISRRPTAIRDPAPDGRHRGGEDSGVTQARMPAQRLMAAGSLTPICGQEQRHDRGQNGKARVHPDLQADHDGQCPPPIRGPVLGPKSQPELRRAAFRAGTVGTISLSYPDPALRRHARPAMPGRHGVSRSLLRHAVQRRRACCHRGRADRRDRSWTCAALADARRVLDRETPPLATPALCQGVGLVRAAGGESEGAAICPAGGRAVDRLADHAAGRRHGQ